MSIAFPTSGPNATRRTPDVEGPLSRGRFLDPPASGVGSRVGTWPAVAVCCVAALALRLPFRIDYAEEVDSIRFLLALDRFDVAAYRPHFPGYPVFVLLGRAFASALGDPVLALSTLCAIAGALLPIPVAILARETLGEREARWAALLCAVNPLLWLHAQMLLSDVPGLLFLFSGLALLAAALRRQRRAGLARASGFVLGLTLGVRLSYFPFVLSAIGVVAWRRRPWRGPALSLGAGVLCWAIPLVAVTGWGPLLEVARVQGSGHFERWGGSVVTEASVATRATMFVWELVAQGLGTWWVDRSAAYLVPTAGLIVLAAIALRRRVRPAAERVVPWIAIVAPYAVWAFLGQNIALKARHVLPLVVLTTLLVAWAIRRSLDAAADRRGSMCPARVAASPMRAAAWTGALLVVAGQTCSGWALAREHRDVPSNAVLLSRAIGARCGDAPGRPVVAYTATLERHVRREAPCAQVVRVQRLSDAHRDFADRGWTGEAYVFSDVAHADRAAKAPFARVRRDRYVQNALSDLSIYKLPGGSDGG